MSILSRAIDLYHEGYIPMLYKTVSNSITRQSYIQYTSIEPHSDPNAYLLNLTATYQSDIFDGIALSLKGDPYIRCIKLDSITEPMIKKLIQIAIDNKNPVIKDKSETAYIYYSAPGNTPTISYAPVYNERYERINFDNFSRSKIPALNNAMRDIMLTMGQNDDQPMLKGRSIGEGIEWGMNLKCQYDNIHIH